MSICREQRMALVEYILSKGHRVTRKQRVTRPNLRLLEPTLSLELTSKADTHDPRTSHWACFLNIIVVSNFSTPPVCDFED